MLIAVNNPNSFDKEKIRYVYSPPSVRETTMLEKIVYCLIGLFNIPLVCGEGEKVLLPLQEEMLRFQIISLRSHENQQALVYTL